MNIMKHIYSRKPIKVVWLCISNARSYTTRDYETQVLRKTMRGRSRESWEDGIKEENKNKIGWNKRNDKQKDVEREMHKKENILNSKRLTS